MTHATPSLAEADLSHANCSESQMVRGPRCQVPCGARVVHLQDAEDGARRFYMRNRRSWEVLHSLPGFTPNILDTSVSLRNVGAIALPKRVQEL
jgi:hypothetical protein